MATSIDDNAVDGNLGKPNVRLIKSDYTRHKNIEYDYIHGKADIKNTIETNNMVLGIDEYLKK